MAIARRDFLKTAALTAGAIVGPWSIAGRKGFAATTSTPALKFLTPSEYKLINKFSREIIPDEPILSGKVDVALNLDGFFATNTSPDFLVMLRYMRLIKLADPMKGLINKLVPATAEDIISFKKMLCALGYYSDANGEADLPPEKRVVWPRIGYGGPKPDNWRPPFSEPQLDQTKLVDRIKEGV
jgi:hypothetical protein